MIEECWTSLWEIDNDLELGFGKDTKWSEVEERNSGLSVVVGRPDPQYLRASSNFHWNKNNKICAKKWLIF